jgi:hypothetical protein
MSVKVYAPAIRDAVEKGNLRQMKSLLAKAKVMVKEQGNLQSAIKRLQTAIAKRSKSQS